MTNLLWAVLAVIYAVNVYLQYKELSGYENKLVRWSLALVLPPLNALQFAVIWIKKFPK